MAENLLLKYLKRTPRVQVEKLPDTTTSTDESADKQVKVKKEKTDNHEPSSRSEPAKVIQSSSNNNKTGTPVNQNATTTPTVISQNKAPPPVPDESAEIDFSSIMGKFGWVVIGDNNLPFILRGEEKFVAVRIVESEIISKYTKLLPWHVFTSTNIKSYYVTENEAKLLNEINDFHSDHRFGLAHITIKDVVVSVTDAIKFEAYLEVCKAKLFPERTSRSERYRGKCGILQINGKILSPYLVNKGTKLVPEAFLSEGMFVSKSSSPMEDWDVAYLKFICHVTGLDTLKIKTGSTLYPVEELQDLMSGKIVDIEEKPLSLANQPISGSSDAWSQQQQSAKNMAALGKQLVSPKISSTRAAPASYWNSAVLPEGLRMSGVTAACSSAGKMNETLPDFASSRYMEPPPMAKVSSNRNSASAIKNNYYPGQNNNNLFPRPPPLIRAGRQLINSSQSAMASSSSLESLSRPPPPLQSNASSALLDSHRKAASAASNLISNGETSAFHNFSGLPDGFIGFPNGMTSLTSLKNLQLGRYASTEDACRKMNAGSLVIPPHHYPTPPQSSPLQASTTPTPVSTSLPLGLLEGTLAHHTALQSEYIDLCSPPPSPDSRKLVGNGILSGSGSLGQSHHHQMVPPHLLQRLEVDGRVISATNLEPYKYQSIMVTALSLVQKTFFPTHNSLQNCHFALKNVLGVQLYNGTGLHYLTLSCQGMSSNGDVLLAISDLQSFLPHLTYMFQHKDKHMRENNYGDESLISPAKKSRLDFSVAGDN